MTITKTIPLGSLSGTFAWSALRGFVDDINAREPAMQERIECHIEGGSLTCIISRELTPAEEVIELRAQDARFRQQLRLLFDAEGRLTSEAAERIRFLVG